MYHFTKICIQKTTRDFFKVNKRYAGHSKWQNIRHVKGEKDAERSILFAQFAKRMKIAILEGKSTKPSLNLKLANIIEEAKKKSMPSATINSLLERIENSKIKSQSELLDFRGPGNSIFIMRILSDNLKGTRNILNQIYKKFSCVASDGKLLNVFQHYGFILTEVDVDLDTATNDAITVGAEDVEQIEDDKIYYKFICDPTHLPKVTNQLSNLNYKIITADEDFTPRATVNLDDNDLKKVDALFTKLQLIEEIVSINHNIVLPDSDKIKVESKH